LRCDELINSTISSSTGVPAAMRQQLVALAGAVLSGTSGAGTAPSAVVDAEAGTVPVVTGAFGDAVDTGACALACAIAVIATSAIIILEDFIVRSAPLLPERTLTDLHGCRQGGRPAM
jgi:hypothetical protein